MSEELLPIPPRNGEGEGQKCLTPLPLREPPRNGTRSTAKVARSGTRPTAKVAGVGLLPFCLLALLLFWAANASGVWWLGATQFASDAFYDGCAGIVTLALPSLLAGLVVGWGVKQRAVTVAAVLFLTLGVAGLLLPLWRVPLVSPHSAHSGAMHYLLHSPLVVLTFGTLGAWLTGQFTTGRWTLADKTPQTPPGD